MLLSLSLSMQMRKWRKCHRKLVSEERKVTERVPTKNLLEEIWEVTCSIAVQQYMILLGYMERLAALAESTQKYTTC